MTKQELAITDDNYRSILAYETKTAHIITAKVLEKPELSAWMILFPIVFVPYMQRHQRYKESAKGFSEGYLYTKKIALDIAYRLYKNDITREEELAIVAETVQRDPNAEELVLNIYHQQIEEIKLLCNHYFSLLDTNEGTFEQMVISHYQTEENYLDFVARLTEAEKEVNRAAKATFNDEEAEVLKIMSRMENKLLKLRVQESKHLFAKE